MSAKSKYKRRIKYSVNRLFATPFTPLWKIQEQQLADEQLKDNCDKAWQLSAKESHARIVARRITSS